MTDQRGARRARAAAVAICAGAVHVAVIQGATPVVGSFADAPAVVRSSRIEWTADPRQNGVSSLSVSKSIEIRSRDGFDFADQVFFYRKSLCVLKSFTAATVQPDGKRIPVPAELIRDAVVVKYGQTEQHSVQFSFPQVQEGSTLEWSYLLEGQLANSFLPPTDWWEVQEDIPVRQADLVVRVRAPEDVAFAIEALSRADVTPFCTLGATQRQDKHWVRTLHCESLPAYEREAFSPPELDQRVRMLVGWFHRADAKAAANSLLWRYVSEFTATRKLVRERATAILGSATGDDALIDRVFEVVGRLKRVEGDGEPPANVDEVLERGEGRGFEAALVALALLEEVGLDVAPALVVDRSEQSFLSNLPDSSQFDRLLLRVRTGDTELYLDPTCSQCRPRTPDWRYVGEGAGGIVLGAGHYKEVRVKPLPAEANIVRRKEQTILAADGAGAVEVAVSWEGQEDLEQRRDWENLTPEGRKQVFLLAEPGVLESPEVTLSDPADRTRNLSAVYRCLRADAALAADGALLAAPRDVFTSRLWIPEAVERLQALWWPYPRAIHLEAVFVAPTGWRVASTPSPLELQGPGMRFTGSWRAGESAAEVVFTGVLTVKVSGLPASRYDEARRFSDALRSFLRDGVTFEPPTGAAR